MRRSGLIIVRMDSAFYAKKVVRACRRAGARFSVTVRMDAAIKRAIATIGEDAWVPIRYPQAIWDEDEQRWISDAQIAETRYTAFAGTKYHREADRAPRQAAQPQAQGRPGRAVRPVAPPRHLHRLPVHPRPGRGPAPRPRRHRTGQRRPRRRPAGPPALRRLQRQRGLAGLRRHRHNLLRAAGHLAAPRYAKARAATLRNDIINVAARIAHRSWQIILHLPDLWPWRHEWTRLFTAVHAPPA